MLNPEFQANGAVEIAYKSKGDGLIE